MSVLLFVDDDAAICRAVADWLAPAGVEVVTAGSVDGAKRCCRTRACDAAIVDLFLSDGTGFELFAWMEGEQPALASHTAFVTGDCVPPVDGKEPSAIGRPVMMKPFTLPDLERLANQLLTPPPHAGRHQEPSSRPAPLH